MVQMAPSSTWIWPRNGLSSSCMTTRVGHRITSRQLRRRSVKSSRLVKYFRAEPTLKFYSHLTMFKLNVIWHSPFIYLFSRNPVTINACGAWFQFGCLLLFCTLASPMQPWLLHLEGGGIQNYVSMYNYGHNECMLHEPSIRANSYRCRIIMRVVFKEDVISKFQYGLLNRKRCEEIFYSRNTFISMTEKCRPMHGRTPAPKVRNL